MHGALPPFCEPGRRTNLTVAIAFDSPGRFFAANEMKAILAYIVLNYDLKIDGDGKRPANIYYANEIIPAVDGMVLFRKRQYPPKV